MKRLLKICIFGLILLCCENAKYSLDNPFDPANIDLNPPALFFHPPEISAKLDTSISVELYGLELEPAAAAHLDIRYDWGSVVVDSVVPGPFFIGQNNPMEITVDEQGVLSIFIFYLPDSQNDESLGGTWSLATVFLSTISTGESELLYGESTTLVDAKNDSIRLKDFGKGYISVE